MKNNMKPKGEIAKRNLSKIKGEIEGVAERLKKARTFLEKIIEDDLKDIGIILPTLKKSTWKKRSMVRAAPHRIEFFCSNLPFYVDFSIVASEGDDTIDTKESIIFGTSRTLCFTDCIEFIKKNNEDQCHQNTIECQRITRCDHLEDKPLIQFSINKQGIIRSTSELEGDWWIDEKDEETTKNNLRDLLYRALDHIWKDALDWTNENILP